MSIRLTKPWQPLARADELPGQLGVFELADKHGAVVYIGYAGGRSRFGLRSAVADAGAKIAAAGAESDSPRSFRVEVTSAYLTRYRELLMAYAAQHGKLPAGNAPEPTLGKLSPA